MCENKNKFVSVVIPVFNDQDGINACLKALSFQSYPKSHYHVLVVDNDSFPSIKIPSAYSRFTTLLKCRKPGSYAARNIGINTAKGEILAFTDADCVPDKDWIDKGVGAMIQNQDRFVIGGEVKFYASDKPSWVEHYQLLSGFMQEQNIKHRAFSATANMFASRTLFEIVGLFNENMLSGGDMEWCWRTLEHGFKVKFISNVIVRTFPRISLISAIRQARRVAGGRHALKKINASYILPYNITHSRSILNSIKSLLTSPHLTFRKRWQMLFIASIIRMAHMFETARLRLGFNPERR